MMELAPAVLTPEISQCRKRGHFPIIAWKLDRKAT
jgi:hypothetical protein